MKIKKIEITIRNKRHYADVAILVDRPDFIDWINKLRAKWRIKKNFKEYHDFLVHIGKQERKNKAREEFEKDVKKVRLAFNRSPNFDNVITHAIAFGKVYKGSYNPCYYEHILDPVDPNDERKDKYAIIVTPNTVLDDIAPILKEIKTRIKKGLEQKKDKKKMNASLADYSFELGPQYTIPSRKVENIVRDRRWYWLHKKMSYNKLLKKILKEGEVITKDGLIRAIKSYEKRLGQI